ncbi:hypothetical protein C3L33_20935, partial [Rhododendron williamsianum]
MHKATELLQQPFENLLEEDSPDCLVADVLFPWASDVATKRGITRDGTENQLTKLIEKVMESEVTSYGVLINSFHELEPAYSEHYSKLLEIAMGLENSGQEFIWVVRKEKKKEEEVDREEWLPDGFEKRLEGKGFIIRGWAPQVLILNHEAVGGFMTHCGWNSLLEGVTAGVPLIAWPLFAEQFYNEKLVIDILRVGIGVGALEWCRWPEEGKIYVKREDIEKAVVQLMVCEEAEGIRSRARALGEMAKKAVEKGGSSYNYLSALLEELELNTN